jgi:hypothetical protein
LIPCDVARPQVGRHTVKVGRQSKPAWADFYNGLAELLGRERAETLMTHLPRNDPNDLVTKSDFSELRSDFSELRAEVRSDFSALGGRLDRMYLTLVAGLFVIVAAMTGVLFTTL